MKICLVGKRAGSLLLEFDKSGIGYERVWPDHAAVALNSGQWADFGNYVKEHSGWALPFAWVFVTWLKTHGPNRRKITITSKDNKIVETEGLDEKEFAKVLEHCKSIIAIEGSPPPPPSSRSKRSKL